MITDPTNTSIGDICTQALREAGAIGVGQTPLFDDINDAWARLQWMLMQWERKRWLVYHLKNYFLTSDGSQYYTIGPGADFDTGADSMRPAKIASAFTRQQVTATNPVDYHLQVIPSMEDYNWITLKELVAGPGEAIFMDSDWPWGKIYVWPIPQAFIYEIHISVYEQLPFQNMTTADTFDIPYEYYGAMLYNLAQRLRPKYRLGTYPGDPLPGMARDSLAVVRAPATQIAKLRMPATLKRRGLYNIFSDRP